MARPQTAPPPQPVIPPVQLIEVKPPRKGKITRLPVAESSEEFLYACLDVLGVDWKTGRARLAVRPGYATLSTGPTAGLFTLGAAKDEPGGVMLMGASSGTLYKFVSGSFSSVGSI